MDGSSGECHAVFERLALRFEAGERREERRMDIEDAVRKFGDKKGREQAHVYGEADEINMEFVEDGRDLAVVGFALEAFRRNHAGLDSTRFRALDTGRAFAIADDDGDVRVRNPTRRDAFRERLGNRGAA